MKGKSLLLLMLMAMFVPLAMNGQTTNQLLSENFDRMSSISTSYSSTSWFAYNAGSGNNWSLNTSSSYANSGSNSAQYQYSSSSAANCYLVSTPFTVSANMIELGVSLYEKVRSSSYPETFDVFFVKANDATSAAAVASATHYSAIASATYSNNTSFAQKTGSVTNSALAGQSVRVVVHCTSAADKWNLYIDDIVVTETVVSGPTVTLSPASATVMMGFTETLTATTINVTGTPTITYSSSNTRVATVSGNGTTATVTGVSTGTATVSATMTYEGRDYTATCDVTVVEPSYCTPSYSYTGTNYGMYIDGFSTEDGETNINSTSTSLGTGGYSDYYNTYSASAEAGQTIGFTVTPGGTVNPMKYGMWIDWNQDYDFDDAGENVAIQSSAIQTVWTGLISIPASTLPGNYRIRVEGMWSGDVDLSPCIEGDYGEAEDYQLIVLAASSCPKPSNLQLTAIGDEVTATWNGNANSYNIDINGIVTPNVTSPYVFTGTLSTEYTIMVQANCEGNETSDWTNPKSVTTDDCLFEDQCPIIITLTDAYGDGGGSMYVVDVNAEIILAELILSGSDSQAFQIYVCDGTELGFYFYATDSYAYENGYVITDPNGEIIAEHEGCVNSSTCSAPTDGVVASYTMNCSCFAPSELTAEVTLNTAELSWMGGQDSYNMRSREVFFFEDFEGGAMPTGWTTINNDGDSYNWYYDNEYSHGHSGNGVMTSASSVNNGSAWVDFEPDNWLVSPQLDLQGTMSVWVRSQNAEASYYQEHFAIYISTTGTNVSDFSILVPENETTIEYIEYTADLSAYAGQKGYIAIRHFNCEGQFRMNIDDFGLYGSWVPQNTDEASANLEGLSSNTTYEVQVQGVDCDGNGNNTDWSESAYFTTGEFYTKHIDAYDGENWYLIASPLAAETAPTDVVNLIPANASNYALYRFNENPTVVNGVGNEWENYKAHTSDFVLEPGRGYLYGNSTEGGVDLIFTGAAYDGDSKDVTLSKTAGAEFEGMNLVGNPFAVEAYIDRDYYTLNATGTEIMTEKSSGAIGPMVGIFVEANQDNETLTFTTQNPAGNKGLVLNLSEGRGVVDRAVIRFGEGRTLHKFMLNENSTKMYIPQEGEDFAVVRSHNSGEVTVNFEPAEDGVYSLSINAENLVVRSLILTDKVERVDIDMLRTPSYQFKASTTDPADRFVLSYKTGSNLFKEMDDRTEFGFFNNGSFMIDNEGEATLQVIDMNGRVLSSETINGNASVKVDAAPGVYMLRLLNGDNVKVQKVVVE